MQFLKTAALTDFELYHLDRDPAETQDLSRTEPAKLAELKSALVAMQQEVRSDGPVWPTFKDPGYEQRVIVWPKYQAKPLPPEK